MSRQGDGRRMVVSAYKLAERVSFVVVLPAFGCLMESIGPTIEKLLLATGKLPGCFSESGT